MNMDELQNQRDDAPTELVTLEGKVDPRSRLFAVMNMVFTGADDPRYPTELFVHITKNKESPPGYRHAWGSAIVSIDREGAVQFAVEEITFEIQMPSPGGLQIDSKNANNVSEIFADTKYYGLGALAPDSNFECNWIATARHKDYGTARVEVRW